jgi:hypothetical protein
LAGGAVVTGRVGTERFPGGLSRDCHPASEGDRAISPEGFG